jgi:hypothetical protein
VGDRDLAVAQDEVDEVDLGPAVLRLVEGQRVARLVAVVEAPPGEREQRRAAHDRDTPRDPAHRERQRNRDDEAVRPHHHRGDGHRRRREVAALLHEAERPHRRREEDRRRVDHREQERRGEQRDEPDRERARARRHVPPGDPVEPGEAEQERDVVHRHADEGLRRAEPVPHAQHAGQEREEGPRRLHARNRLRPVPRLGDGDVPEPVPLREPRVRRQREGA